MVKLKYMISIEKENGDKFCDIGWFDSEQKVIQWMQENMGTLDHEAENVEE